jgi:hypothetical protein
LNCFRGKLRLPRDGFRHAGHGVGVALHVFQVGGVADEVEHTEHFPHVILVDREIDDGRARLNGSSAMARGTRTARPMIDRLSARARGFKPTSEG